MDELSRTGDGRAVLRMRRRLAHPPAKVWRALTDPAELSQWFPAAVSMTAAPGEKISFDMGDGPMAGQVVQVDPPHRFEFTWGGDVLRWELAPDGDGCLLTFTHVFDDRAGAGSFAAGWHECLRGLELLVAGEPVRLARPSAELHDRYLVEFGLDEGVVEPTADGGWRVRFERQLTRPAQSVWELLADGPLRPGTTPAGGFTIDQLRPGPVTEVTPPELLAYELRAGERFAGEVRWELSDPGGTGHGARLLLTQTGPADLPAERDAALAGWRDHLRGLARRLRAAQAR